LVPIGCNESRIKTLRGSGADILGCGQASVGNRILQQSFSDACLKLIMLGALEDVEHIYLYKWLGLRIANVAFGWIWDYLNKVISIWLCYILCFISLMKYDQINTYKYSGVFRILLLKHRYFLMTPPPPGFFIV